MPQQSPQPLAATLTPPPRRLAGDLVVADCRALTQKKEKIIKGNICLFHGSTKAIADAESIGSFSRALTSEVLKIDPSLHPFLLMLMEWEDSVSKKKKLAHPMDSTIKEAPTNATSMNQHLLWSQWQLLDSILPTGGFAHSYGLEAAMQSRMVNNPEDMRSFVIQVLENTGSLLLPFVYCASKSPDAAAWVKLDQLLEATLANEVGRKASTSQGSALLRVAARVFTEVQSLQDLRQTFLGSKSVSFHHAPIFGAICGLLDSTARQRSVPTCLSR